MGKIKFLSGRILKTLLAAAMFVMLVGMTASAAGEVFVDMPQNAEGTYVYTGQWEDYSTTVYHKITVPKTGALVVNGCNIYSSIGSLGSINVELYNSKLKKVDSDYGQWLNADKEEIAIYGVKKGTYYLKTSGDKQYILSAAFETVTNKGGTSKKKAYTVKHKKTIKGVMPAGEKASATDWYKFKVTKKKILQLKLAAANTGNFEFWLYGPSYKKGLRIDSLDNESNSYYSINSLTKKKIKVKTGTYYIKVKRSSYDKKASGIYSIYWRLR